MEIGCRKKTEGLRVVVSSGDERMGRIRESLRYPALPGAIAHSARSTFLPSRHIYPPPSPFSTSHVISVSLSPSRSVLLAFGPLLTAFPRSPGLIYPTPFHPLSDALFPDLPRLRRELHYVSISPPLCPLFTVRAARRPSDRSCRTPTRRSFVTVSLTTPRRNFDKRKKKDTEDGGGGRRTPVEFSAPLEAAGNV